LLLLDTAPDIIDGGEPKPHDVERIEDSNSVGQAGRRALA
jgi:hypothetical protein